MKYKDDQSLMSDALIGRERIRGASRMIAEGTEASAVSDEQIKQIAADLQLFIRNYRVSLKEVANRCGFESPGVISEFIKGTYKGNIRQVAIYVDGYLMEEERRRSKPETTQFVYTNVALMIKSVAGYCHEKKKIGLVYGPDTSGMGKTMALQAIYEERGPRTCGMATIEKTDANTTGVLKKICAAIGKQDSGTNAIRFQRIVDFLKPRSFLLLVDEAHNLRHAKDDKPLYVLSGLFNQTKQAQLWCGTADLYSYLHRQRARSGDESLTQIASRIFPQVDLVEALRSESDGGGPICATTEQVREMFARNQMRITSDAIRFLCRLANMPDSGSIRLCVQIVEYATMLAEMRNLSSIDTSLLQEALRRGITNERAKLLLMQEESHTSTRIARSA